MNNIKIFLASSAELKTDRDQFEIFINRKNKDWVNKGAHLELVIWEDFLDCISKTRLQDEYDKAIHECDIFILLFSTKVGKYTEEEFQTAYDLFLETGNPKIYTYCKEQINNQDSPDPQDQKSVINFQKKLQELGHFQTNCQNTQDFLLHFTQQLDKLVATGVIKFEETASPSKAIPHTLTLPPFKPEVFLGREEDLSTIKDKLFQQNTSLFLLSGEGGLGKTSLASEYYHTYQEEYKHVAWVLSEKNIANAMLTNLAGPLGVKFENTMPQQERLDKLVTTMTSLPKPCLLVIDNANETEDLEENYLALRRFSNFHILLTTRIPKFHNAASYLLQNLPKEKALELFRIHYPYHILEENELFYQIREAIGGNTLVIEILAKNLAILNQNENAYTLKRLLSDIQSKGLLNTSETKSLETDYHAGHILIQAKPSDIIATMYDLGNLSTEETAVLSVFAVLPPEKIEFKVLITLLDPSIQPEMTLQSLAQKGWIEFNQDTRSYKCSPVIQEITKKKNPKLYEDCEYLISQINEKLDYDKTSGMPLKISLTEAEIFVHYGESIVKTFFRSCKKIGILNEEIGTFFKVTGDYLKSISYFMQNHMILTELCQIDKDDIEIKNLLGLICFKIGNIYKFTGNQAQSLFFNEQCALIEKELVETNPTNFEYKINLAKSFQGLGDIYLVQGNLEKANLFFLQQNEYSKECFVSDPKVASYKNGYALSIEKLGEVCKSKGELEKALQYFSEFDQLEHELSIEFPMDVAYKNNLTVGYTMIGDIYLQLGNKEKSLDYHNRCYQLASEKFKAYPQNAWFKFGFILACERLGDLNFLLGNHKQAILKYKKNLELSLELYLEHPDNVEHKDSIGLSNGKLADVYASINDPAKALTHYSKFNLIEKELYEAFPLDVRFKNNLAISSYLLGNLYKNQLNDLPNAISHYKQAEHLWTELVKEAPGFEDYKTMFAEVQEALKGCENEKQINDQPKGAQP